MTALDTVGINALIFLLIALGTLDVALRLSVVGNLTPVAYTQQVLFGADTLGGIYLLLYVISQGRWIGLGDVKLGMFMGMILGWEHALLALFCANVLFLIVVGPARIAGKIPAWSRLPFGPFLIIAFVLIGLLSTHILA